MVSSFQNTLKKETNLNMYTGVCQNRHILFFLHKALTFSSQGFFIFQSFCNMLYGKRFTRQQ